MPFPARYDDAILNTRGCVLYLPMDDIQGTRARDLTRYKLSGTIASGATSRSRGDDQVDFNGSSGYISVPDNAAIDVANNFTIEVFFKRDQNDRLEVICCKGLSTATPVFVATDNLLYVYSSGPDGEERHTSTSITVSSGLTYIAYCKNGSDRRFYHNAVEVGTGGADLTYASNAFAQLIGCDNADGAPNGLYFDGVMHHFAIYNRTLTAGEVREHYMLSKGH